jgi:hypothetical protein
MNSLDYNAYEINLVEIPAYTAMNNTPLLQNIVVNTTIFLVTIR